MLKRSVIAGAIAFAIVSIACTNSATTSGGGGPSGTASGGATVKEGGILRLAAFDGIDSLNPFVGINDDSYSTYENIYPYLVQYDEKLNFAPDFATSWTHTTDGATWTFKTQPNGRTGSP
jgi:ABC-type transport system substrate-binding protein